MYKKKKVIHGVRKNSLEQYRYAMEKKDIIIL